LPVMLGKDDQMTHEFLYWEFPEYQGQQAVRMGKWKSVRKDIKKGNMKMELYNLDLDPVESTDIANDHADIMQTIGEIMKREHEQAQIERFRMAELGDQ